MLFSWSLICGIWLYTLSELSTMHPFFPLWSPGERFYLGSWVDLEVSDIIFKFDHYELHGAWAYSTLPELSHSASFLSLAITQRRILPGELRHCMSQILCDSGLIRGTWRSTLSELSIVHLFVPLWSPRERIYPGSWASAGEISCDSTGCGMFDSGSSSRHPSVKSFIPVLSRVSADWNGPDWLADTSPCCFYWPAATER